MKRNHKTLIHLAILGIVVAGTLPARAATLEECIHAALSSNTTIRIARHAVESSESQMKKTQSAYWPHLLASSSYMRTDNPPQAFMMSLNQRSLNMMDPAFDPNSPEDTENIRMSLGLQYRLYDGGRRRMDYRMAKDGIHAAESGHVSAKNELIHQVTVSYYQVLQAQAFTAVQREAIRSLEESLRIARERFIAGSSVKTDVLNLEVKLAEAQEDLVKVENATQLAVEMLNMTIGQKMVSLDKLPPPPSLEQEAAIPAFEPNAYKGRAELEAARRMLAIRENGVRKARGSRLPTLNAFGSMNWDSEDLSDQEESYFAGVQLEWKLFTGFYNREDIRQAQAERDAAEATLQRAKDQLKLDLKQAHLKVIEGKKRLTVTQKSIESAEEALRITQEQYARGSADISNLLTAQVGFTAIKTRAVAARYDYLMAWSNFRRAQGSLLKQYQP